MTLHELEREALRLTPVERALLAELMLRSLGQALQQMSPVHQPPRQDDRSLAEARIESVFAEAFSGEAELWTNQHWDRLLEDDLPELEPGDLDELALPRTKRH